MRKFNLEEMIRNIVQDELARTFTFASQNMAEEPREAATETTIANEDEVTLQPLKERKTKTKNSGRGRVTRANDKRLRANKK